MKFTRFKRVGQNVDTFAMEFVLLRQEAEARMLMGSGFPAERCSVKNEDNSALAMQRNSAASSGVSA